MLIVSFESLRAHAPLLADAGVGLVICDEAHRLKNDRALVTQTIRVPTLSHVALDGDAYPKQFGGFVRVV